MLTEIEQQTLDIDWFFTNGQEIAFVASGGGKLPKSVANSDNISLLSSFFRNLSKTSEAIINPNSTKLKKILPDNQYFEDFIYMAEKGLFTYDKSILNDFSNSNYDLITIPSNSIKLDRLPLEIRNMIMKTKTNDINEYIDTSSFE